jgi:DNA repair exonuclease SbcCD nuclease subunit
MTKAASNPTHQYIRLQRIREWELEKAVEEKLAEEWELHTPILPVTKSGAAWGTATQGKYTLDHYKGSYMTQKFFCTMRKEINVLKKSEARKRVATINQTQNELLDELFKEIEQLKHENNLLKISNKNLLKSRSEKETLRKTFENNYKRVNRLNNHLDKENADLRVKVDELTKSLSGGKKRARNGVYLSVVKVGKKWRVLDEHKTPEEAEKREKEAYKNL